MKPYQAVGWTLLNASAVTAIAGNNVWHGLRPEASSLPSITYYEVGSTLRQYGIETVTFSLNCRGSTAGAARDLARVVVDTFHGTAGSGVYGTNNGFDIARASLRNDNGLIPEPDTLTFNAPVDVQVVFPSQTVT